MPGKASRRRVVPLVALAVGLASTAAVSVYAHRAHTEREHARFARSTFQTRSEIAQRLDATVAMLHSTAGLFAASEYVTREEFGRFVDQLDLPARYPGVAAIGFSQRSVNGDDGAILERIRREFGVEFGGADSAEARERHRIIYLESIDGDGAELVGTDLFALEACRAVIEQARDRAAPVVSAMAPLRATPGPEGERGLYIFVPYYEGDEAPETAEERRRALVGFTYAAVRPESLFGSVSDGSRRLAEFAILESGGADTGPVVYATERHGEFASDASRRALRTAIAAPHREWTLWFVSNHEFEATRSPNFAALVAGAGTLISFLLYGLVRVQELAAQRSEEDAARLRASERGLRESEARKGAILESAIDAIITMDHEGRIVEWNSAAERIFGWSRTEAIGRRLSNLIVPPDGREGHTKGLDRFLQTGRGEILGKRIETMALRSDGTSFPVELCVSRVGSTNPPEFTGFIRDITERARAERQRKLMNRELDHRVKNNLFAVMAILNESARRASSIEELVTSVSGRLQALARLHELLGQQSWQSAPLDQLVRTTLEPYQSAARAERVRIEGPGVLLGSAQASSLCVALHELATNAAKYGSLLSPTGTVDVSWNVHTSDADGETLRLTWKERGGPPVTAPRERGFGSLLIEDGLRFETGGRCEIEYQPEGVVCRIEMPLRAGEDVDGAGSDSASAASLTN